MTEVTSSNLTLLLTYTPQQQRDSWIVLGRAIGTSTAPAYYGEGLLYKVSTPGFPLDGFILFFTDRFAGVIDWTQYQYVNGIIQRISDQMIPSFVQIILPATAVPDETAYPPNLSFVPFPEYEIPTTVQMADYELKRVMVDVGIPFLSFDDLEYGPEQIKAYILRPALEEYYKWFPITRPQVYTSTSVQFSVPYPPDAIGIRRVLGMNVMGSLNTGPQSPFMYYADLTQGGMMGSGMPGGYMSHPYDRQQAVATMMSERASKQAILNEFTQIEWKDVDRAVTGFYTGGGQLMIEWNYLDDDFSVIPIRRIDEVRKLFGARIMRALGMLRLQSRQDTTGVLNYQTFLDEAKLIETEIITAWRDFTKSVVIRNR